MSMTVEDFQNECGPHIEALQALLDRMPEHGLKSEDCQRLTLLNALSKFENAVDSVEPFDFVDVDMMNSDLHLKDSAEEAFNEDPSLKLYEVEVWFNEEEDTTTVVEDYICLIAAESEEQVEFMGEQIHQMLSVDDALFVNINHIELVHPKSAE